MATKDDSIGGRLGFVCQTCGAEFDGDRRDFECQTCGAEFEVEHYICPGCGGFSVERSW